MSHFITRGRRCSAVSFTLFAVVTAAVMGGCANPTVATPPPLDLTPVACGHKWIQSAHSAATYHDCNTDPAVLLASLEPETQEALMAAARIRCPAQCTPVELTDPFDDHASEFTNCVDGRIYLRVSKFLHCRRP